MLKFIYYEKATKFLEISIIDLTVTTSYKSKVEISQKNVAFSEYMNFTAKVKVKMKKKLYVLQTLEFFSTCEKNKKTSSM